ncbi:MAG: hypothetical protein QG589_218 [Patescibacteria group bacterium]|nr:hypothetical protein [Patescibacteria group bacterium]
MDIIPKEHVMLQPIVCILDEVNAGLVEKIINQSKTDKIYPRHDLGVVINSQGGKVEPGIRLVRHLENLQKNDVFIDLRIYNAVSMAAVIALAIRGGYREMERDGTLLLHTGSFLLQPSDIDNEGIVGSRLKKEISDYKDLFSEILKRFPKLHSDNHRMATLAATGWLRLSAPECLELELVDQLF